jgi:hypothetical protein
VAEISKGEKSARWVLVDQTILHDVKVLETRGFWVKVDASLSLDAVGVPNRPTRRWINTLHVAQIIPIQESSAETD